MRIPLLTLLALSAVTATATAAGTLYLTPDTPADLSENTYTASDIVRSEESEYTLALDLPEGLRIDGLQRMESGDWLVSPVTAVTLDGAAFDSCDVLRYDGIAFTLYFDGSASGIPEGVNVDAVALDGSDDGPLLLSVDVPARIDRIDAQPADVLRFSSGVFTLLFDASAASPSIDPPTNVVGVDRMTADLLLTFDIPATLDGTTHLPGDVVRWDGTGFAPHRKGVSNGWSIQHEVAGFSRQPAPGTVAGLAVVRVGAQLVLQWTESCSEWASDYGIYQGTLGDFGSHTAIDCSDDGHDLKEEIPLPAASRYYLVVPHTTMAEGSYGVNSAGVDRPAGVATCRRTQASPICR